MTLSLPSLQRSKSLYEQTYQTLRASILSGELAPGERLIETQLAELLQVSRTPIREAIRQLQRETLITADASGGLRVTTVSTVDAAQLYDCRIALEQLSVQGACQNATSEQLQAIDTLVIQAEQLLARSVSHPQSPQQSPQMLDLDYRFHRLIAESSGNQWLVHLLEQVFNQMTLLRMQTTRHNPQVLEIRNEHRQIYQAIAQRDQAAATEMIQAHLIASKARVIQEVENLQRGAIANPTVQPYSTLKAQQPMTATPTDMKRVFICGSALRGQPDHQNLQSATFLRSAKTQPLYRLHSVADGWHPAIYQVDAGGISIPGEVYELTLEQYDHLISTEPPDMYPADVILDDEEVVTAILYPRELIEKYGWVDISDYGGWAAYKAAQ